jgi:hypothetical protein
LGAIEGQEATLIKVEQYATHADKGFLYIDADTDYNTNIASCVIAVSNGPGLAIRSLVALLGHFLAI